MNADETGVLLVPCPNETYEESGGNQLSIQGFGDKRQFTLLFGVNATGKFAGRLQLIWSSLPKQGVMDSFKKYVFNDVSESHPIWLHSILHFTYFSDFSHFGYKFGGILNLYHL